MPLKGDTIAMINGAHSYYERRGFVVRTYRIGGTGFMNTCDVAINRWRFNAQSPGDMSISSKMVLTEKSNE